MKADLLRVVEGAYAQATDEAAWLRGMLEAARPSLDGGMGVLGFSFRVSDAPLEMGPVVEMDDDAEKVDKLRRSIHEGPQDRIRDAFSSSRVLTLSELLGKVEGQPFLEPHRSALAVGDSIGVFTVDPAGHGVVFNAFLREPRRLSPAFRRSWSCVAAHVGAGFRLRRRSAAQSTPPEAILDASGKLQHAEGPARDRDARVALRQAARAIDRARSSRNQDPDAAVELWRALVEERWSLVDQFDSDGRHFLIAHRNPVQAPAIRDLSESERRVTALAARGRANKLIAYELGLATGTVGTLLSRAARKVGVSSRSALIAYWHRRERSGSHDPR